MFLPNSVKIFIASAPADMRRSHNGLSGLVRQQFTESILSGHLFVFYNKRRQRIKILFYDRGGLALYYKKSPASKDQMKKKELTKVKGVCHEQLRGPEARQDPQSILE